MTIYEKIQRMRVILQEKKLKKSGYNSFKKFYYYQLDDLLPTINELLLENKMVSKFDLTAEKAILSLIDYEIKRADDPTGTSGCIIFEAPFMLADIQGANAIQNLGGAITYLRRYLFITAFEICEQDSFDADENKQPEAPKTVPSATSYGLNYSMDIIKECKTIERLEQVRLELGKKKWSAVDAAELKIVIDEKRKELNANKNN